MMEIVPELIDQYCKQKSSAPSELAKELEMGTREKFAKGAPMLTGSLEASVLGFLIRIAGVKRILELGTFTGYSALCMAENLPEDGEVITLDVEPETVNFGKTFWNRSPHGKKIKSILGPALDSVQNIHGNFDLVFVDADKGNYLNYFNALFTRLSSRGFMVFDNCLWDGKVLNPLDEQTQAIVRLNDHLQSRDDIYRSLLSVRDGIFLVIPKR